MTMLEERLRSLGDALDLDTRIDEDSGPNDMRLVDAVLARLDDPPARRPGGDRPWLRVAAALVLAVALVVVAVPSSRRTVADWFGFDGVRLERRPGAPAVSVPDPFDRDVTGDVSPDDDSPDDGASDDDSPVDPSAGSIGTVVEVDGTVVEVDGTDVLVSEFVGTLDNPAIGKTVGDGTDVQQVSVGGELGIWIDGAPHDVSFYDERGTIVFERFAGNTLLWQDGEVVRRIEGFPDAATAIAYAEQFGT